MGIFIGPENFGKVKEWQKSKPAAAQLWELQCACVSRREVLLTGDDEACEMPVKNCLVC